jgi:hypothetical protein
MFDSIIWGLTLASWTGKVKTEGDNVDLTRDSDENYATSITLSTEISFKTSSDESAMMQARNSMNTQYTDRPSDAFLVPAISIKVQGEILKYIPCVYDYIDYTEECPWKDIQILYKE